MTVPGRPPIDVVDLFPVLDAMLMDLLESLAPEEWDAPTVAKLWRVKDVVAHLLDGNVRGMSILRDGYFGEAPERTDYRGMVHFLNRLNADWVQAMRRASPATLILLHQATGKAYCDVLKDLDPFAKSALPVDWAGESESLNWMHAAREYSEKFLHQQQIREATGRPGLLTRELFRPFLDVFMRALPHTYRGTAATEGAWVRVTVIGDIGGSWDLLRRGDAWMPGAPGAGSPTAEVLIRPEDAWPLFSKSARPDEVKGRVEIRGDRPLAEVALGMVSVMA